MRPGGAASYRVLSGQLQRAFDIGECGPLPPHRDQRTDAGPAQGGQTSRASR
jgi:hypothetical protein